MQDILNKINKELKEWDEECSMKIGRRDSIIDDISAQREEYKNALEVIENCTKANKLCTKLAEKRRELSKEQLDSIVTDAIQYAFGTDYEFETDIVEKGKHGPSAEFYVSSKYEGEDLLRSNVRRCRSGGLRDNIGLALLFGMLQCYKPRINGPIIIDEPVTNVSQDKIDEVSKFIKSMNEIFKRQIILITHITHLYEASDRVFAINLEDGVSKVQAIK